MIVGKEGISAKIIADSIYGSSRLTTFELEYPRFVHSEFLTHRMLSKNCASSRAIPISKMIEQIKDNPAMPVWWGKNQSGMQAKEELSGVREVQLEWLYARLDAIKAIEKLEELGLHKQISNRISEPWMRMKTVVSGTEWTNLLWLRDHADAQPEFAELAKCVREEFNQSTPKELKVGEWHLPYVDYEKNEDLYDVETALKVSASCCAQVSYRKNDDSVEKAIQIYDRLVGMEPKHSSPFEHQGTPIDKYSPGDKWAPGVTHITRDGNLWSGNFKGWIQHRQLIPNHVKW
jgi:hypothetical protein